MPEYIERDEAIRTAITVCSPLTQFDAVDIAEAMENIPTADVVEVVRCKDCEHYIEYPLSKRAKEIAPWGKCNKNKHLVYPTDFCGYGERK